MDKKYLTLFLVVVVGVALGLCVVNMKYNDPVKAAMLEQQNKMLESLNSINASLKTDDNSQMESRITMLEKRIDTMESQWRSLQDAIKTAGNNQARAVAAPSDEYTKVYDIPAEHSPIIGNKNAAVTIVEFVDFQCPFCSRFHEPIVEVLKAYPEDVNYLVKNFPLSFHPQAKPGSKVALAAGEQGKYAEMVDMILADNKSLSAEKYREFAKEIGLNMKKFEKDLKDNDAKYEQYIKDDMQLGASVGVRGTPTFFINGRKTVARDLVSFKKEIDSILAEK